MARAPPSLPMKRPIAGRRRSHRRSSHPCPDVVAAGGAATVQNCAECIGQFLRLYGPTHRGEGGPGQRIRRYPPLVASRETASASTSRMTAATRWLWSLRASYDCRERGQSKGTPTSLPQGAQQHGRMAWADSRHILDHHRKICAFNIIPYKEVEETPQSYERESGRTPRMSPSAS